jgi:NAD(P)-dependent dehydrogenase (short-subunit alcohol dehydrogenase family)
VPRDVTGDLSTIAEARIVADQANNLGRFDAVIHNAGIGYRETKRSPEFLASSPLMCSRPLRTR